MTDYRAERDEALIDKIGKLLAKASSTKIEAERDLFNAKAMELIAANNLDMAAIEIGGNSAKAAKRTDEKLAGGLYQWQRDLWKAVSDLNFCMYWTLYVYDAEKTSKYWIRKYGGKANVPDWRKGGYRFQHRLVGRMVNVQATRVMAEYLSEAIERALKDELSDGTHLFSEWANGFRMGAADEVIHKLVLRREELLADEKAKELRREAELRAKAAEGFSTERAVTLSSVKESEHAANYDFLHGEGAWAGVLARRADAARRAKEAQDRYTKWAAENPEEAKKAEEEATKERRKAWRTSWNAGMGKSKYDKGGYNTGARAGRKIGIDQQMDRGTKGALSHG